MEFKEILKEYLQTHGMTQTEFAARAGVKQSQVSEWLKGKARPAYDILKQPALRFEMPAEYRPGIE